MIAFTAAAEVQDEMWRPEHSAAVRNPDSRGPSAAAMSDNLDVEDEEEDLELDLTDEEAEDQGRRTWPLAASERVAEREEAAPPAQRGVSQTSAGTQPPGAAHAFPRPPSRASMRLNTNPGTLARFVAKMGR